MVIPTPTVYDTTCVWGQALGDELYLWDQVQSALSEVTVPRPLFKPSMSKNVAVLQSMALLRLRGIWVGDTGASVHCTNNIVGAHNVQEPPSVTTLGQNGTAAIWLANW